MRRISPSFIIIIIAILIIAILGISIVIPNVSFSQSYNEVPVETGWTPIVSKTPTQTLTPSITFTPYRSPTPTALGDTPTPELVDCVYPAGYWGDHPELWLEMLVGNSMYSKDDIRLIFNNPIQGVHNTLFIQLYLANLNIFSGADPGIIEDALVESNNWLQKYMPYKQVPEVDRLVGLQLAQTLAEFNTGMVGPGFCPPYEALTVTPLVIISPTATSSATPVATSTPTRVIVTWEPSATATKDKDSDKEPEPTDPPRPTKEPPPKPTDPPPKPTDPPPEPTDAPTEAP